MKIENIKEAERECERFLKRLQQLKQNQPNRKHFEDRAKYTYPSIETSALKRSSMDLTRSLSKMRQDTWKLKH